MPKDVKVLKHGDLQSGNRDYDTMIFLNKLRLFYSEYIPLIILDSEGDLKGKYQMPLFSECLLIAYYVLNTSLH